MPRNYKELRVWKKANQLTLDLHRITKTFPETERFGLIQQINRASSSIGANIVEGCGQNSSAATLRYFFIAYSSLKEIEYHILLSKDLNFITKERYDKINEEITLISKMLYNLILKMPKKTRYIKPNST